ncbi:MAG: Mov34/MPN/PAD-1 family protein [Myxococcaceae bacterium]|nr:Mov34/MPN/PAD-1 family protein [Myxococcaceae bacterium]
MTSSAFPPSLAEAVADAEARAPREAVSVYRCADDGAWHFQRLTNRAAGELAFELDALEWAALERDAGRGLCLVHSHVDGPAVLSAKDVAAFTVGTGPLIPGLSLVVLGLQRGRVVEARGYVFAQQWVHVELFDTFSLQSHRDLH